MAKRGTRGTAKRGTTSATQRRAVQLHRGGKLGHVSCKWRDASLRRGKIAMGTQCTRSMEDLFESDGGR